VLIAPTDELAAKEKLALEANAAISDLEPVRTESFALSYAKADDVRKLLTDKDQKILSKRGTASMDERTKHALRARTRAGASRRLAASSSSSTFRFARCSSRRAS
jgi:hypothetical protein